MRRHTQLATQGFFDLIDKIVKGLPSDRTIVCLWEATHYWSPRVTLTWLIKLSRDCNLIELLFVFAKSHTVARQVSVCKTNPMYNINHTYSAHSFIFPEFWLSTIFKIKDLFSSRYCMPIIIKTEKMMSDDSELNLK